MESLNPVVKLPFIPYLALFFAAIVITLKIKIVGTKHPPSVTKNIAVNTGLPKLILLGLSVNLHAQD